MHSYMYGKERLIRSRPEKKVGSKYSQLTNFKMREWYFFFCIHTSNPIFNSIYRKVISSTSSSKCPRQDSKSNFTRTDHRTTIFIQNWCKSNCIDVYFEYFSRFCIRRIHSFSFYFNFYCCRTRFYYLKHYAYKNSTTF